MALKLLTQSKKACFIDFRSPAPLTCKLSRDRAGAKAGDTRPGVFYGAARTPRPRGGPRLDSVLFCSQRTVLALP